MRTLRMGRDFWMVEEIVRRLWSSVRSISLWRRIDEAGDQWAFLARLHPHDCTMEEILDRFGGGDNRATLLGWVNPVTGRHGCVPCEFTIGGPPTLHTRSILARRLRRRCPAAT